MREIEIVNKILDNNPDYKKVENEVLKEFKEIGLIEMSTKELQEGVNIIFDFSYRKDIYAEVLSVVEGGKAFLIQVRGYHSPLLLNANELQNIRRA